MVGFILSYLKSKIKYLSVVAVFLAVYLMLFYSYELPMDVILYGFIIFLVFLLLFVSIDFFHAYKRHRELEELEKTVVFGAGLPEPRTVMEQDYSAVIEKLRAENAALASRYDIKEKEMDDYYTMWVHQIKTPISAMNLMLQNEELNRSKLKAELFKTEQYAEMALAYLRLEAVNSDLSFTRLSVGAVVKKCLKKYAKIFALKKISLQMDRVEIEAVSDEKWLSFVIEQLLSNALKYTPEGGLVKIYSSGKRLVIQDNGIGIHQEDLPRVFEKGFTGYNGRTDRKSTGLGLYLCKKTLTVLSHEISIESDKGTKVNIDFHESGVNLSD